MHKTLPRAAACACALFAATAQSHAAVGTVYSVAYLVESRDAGATKTYEGVLSMAPGESASASVTKPTPFTHSVEVSEREFDPTGIVNALFGPRVTRNSDMLLTGLEIGATVRPLEAGNETAVVDGQFSLSSLLGMESVKFGDDEDQVIDLPQVSTVGSRFQVKLAPGESVVLRGDKATVSLTLGVVDPAAAVKAHEAALGRAGAP